MATTGTQTGPVASEPIAGYDELSTEQVVAALGDADVRTLNAVRDYEVRARARQDVLRPVARLRRERAALAATADAPEVVWKADARPGFLGGVANVGVVGLMLFAGVLMLAAIVILGFLVLVAFAPDALHA